MKQFGQPGFPFSLKYHVQSSALVNGYRSDEFIYENVVYFLVGKDECVRFMLLMYMHRADSVSIVVNKVKLIFETVLQLLF